MARNLNIRLYCDYDLNNNRDFFVMVLASNPKANDIVETDLDFLNNLFKYAKVDAAYVSDTDLQIFKMILDKLKQFRLYNIVSVRIFLKKIYFDSLKSRILV